MIDDDSARPRAGDPSLCIRCGGLAVFTGRGTEIRRCSDAELVTLSKDPEVLAARHTLRRMWAELGRPE